MLSGADVHGLSGGWVSGAMISCGGSGAMITASVVAVGGSVKLSWWLGSDDHGLRGGCGWRCDGLRGGCGCDDVHGCGKSLGESKERNVFLAVTISL